MKFLFLFIIVMSAATIALSTHIGGDVHFPEGDVPSQHATATRTPSVAEMSHTPTPTPFVTLTPTPNP